MAVAVDAHSAAVVAGLRRLLWGRGLSAVGDGLWFTIWAVYFTRVLGLSTGTVGVGLAIAAGVGLAATVPLGALADRRDPRGLLVGIVAVRAAGMACYLLVEGVLTFIAVTVVFVALANGSAAVRTALVAGLVDDNGARIRVLAQQRVAQHIGYAVGAGTGAAVLAFDRPAVYAGAIIANVTTFAGLAAVTATVPKAPPSDSQVGPGSARIALADRPYVAVTAVVAVLSLCWAMLSTGLPIWVQRSTHVPVATSGLAVVISSVGIAALQVPATRLVPTLPRAARVAVLAGVTLAASALLLSTTSGGSGLVTVGVIIVAALLHLAGELGYVASSWALSMGLMREDARGAYQGLAEAATATVQIFGPAVFTLSLGVFGGGGWLVVAALFLVAAALVPTTVRRAVGSRPATGPFLASRSG